MKPCYCGCSNRKVKRGLWSPDEDEKLRDFISVHGIKCWSLVPIEAGLERCGKSCRLRWLNYLRPGVKRGNFSLQEQRLIFELQALFGNRWSWIARRIPGRTDNEIKNFWNVCKARQRMTNSSAMPASAQFCSQLSNYKMAVPFIDAQTHENVKLCNSMPEVADANSNFGVSYHQEAPSLYAQPLNADHVADIESWVNELSTWQVDMPTWQADMAGFQADLSNFDWSQVMQSHDLSFLSQNAFA